MKKFLALLLLILSPIGDTFGEGTEYLKLGTQTHTVLAPLVIDWAGTTQHFEGATLTGISGGGGGGSILSESVARVDASGNDGTGTVGDIGKPFLTVQGAIDAIEAGSFPNPTILLGNTQSNDPITTSLSTLAIRGEVEFYCGIFNTITLTNPTFATLLLQNAGFDNVVANTGSLSVEISNAYVSNITNSGGTITATTAFTDGAFQGTISAPGNTIDIYNAVSQLNHPTINSAGSDVTATNSRIETVTNCNNLTLIDSRVKNGTANATGTVTYTDFVLKGIGDGGTTGQIQAKASNDDFDVEWIDADYQPLDSDLTSWAAVTRASGFDTFTATPNSANLRGLLTDESGTGVFLTANGSAASLTSFPTGSTLQAWDADLDTWATKTPYAGTLTITTGKTFDVTNNLTLSGTDGSTLAIGTGGTLGTAAYTASGAYQPIDSDLTTIAGLTATTDNFLVSVSSLWASRTPAQVRTTLGLVIGTNVEAWDADLDSWAGVTRASGFDTFTTTPDSAGLRGLLTDESGTGVFLTANGSAASLTSFPTFNQSTTGSAASLSITGQTALLTFTGPTSTNRAKAVRDAADTILELGGSYTPSGIWTSLTMVTPVLGTPTSGNLANCTFPTLNQNTSGSAATLTTARNLWGQSFNGSADIGGNIELGTAGSTDTTLARASAGVGSIEGSNILLASGLGSITQAWDTQLDSLAGLAYTGNTLKVVRVNAGENGFELVSPSAGSGTVTNTGGNLTSNAVVLGAGTVDTKVAAGIITDGTSQLTLGVNTTTIGKVKMFGNTSGDATIQPTAIAGTATVVTLPNASSTLPIFGQQITFTGPTAARSIALPDAAFTVARIDAANTFVGSHIFSSATSLLLGTAGSAVGDIGFRNATSGTATLGPPTGALGTYSVTLPNAASTLPIYPQQITYTGPTAARTVTYPDASFTVVGTTAAQTLTTKRVVPRTNTTASNTSWTPDFDTYDVEKQTALAGAVTINAPTYASTNEGECRVLRIKDNGTARAITWTTGSGGAFRASTDLILPTTTTLSKTLYLLFIYNATDSRWDLLAKLDNF